MYIVKAYNVEMQKQRSQECDTITEARIIASQEFVNFEVVDIELYGGQVLESYRHGEIVGGAYVPPRYVVQELEYWWQGSYLDPDKSGYAYGDIAVYDNLEEAKAYAQKERDNPFKCDMRIYDTHLNKEVCVYKYNMKQGVIVEEVE